MSQLKRKRSYAEVERKLPIETVTLPVPEKTGVLVAKFPGRELSSTAYLCGGQSVFRGGPISSILRRSRHGVWEEAHELNEHRTAAGVAVFDGSLFVVGGAGSGPTPANRKSTVESLRLAPVGEETKGTQVSKLNVAQSMTSPRMLPGVAVAGGVLWAIGGW